MKNSKADVAQKRMLLFTKVIMTLLTVTVLIFMNFLDLQESKRNQQYLNLLAGVYGSGSNSYPFEKYEIQRMEYLQQHSSGVGNKHLNSRQRLINILGDFNMLINRSVKGEGTNKNNFVLMHSSQVSLSKTKVVSPTIEYSKSTVDSAMIFFRNFSKPDKVILLKEFDYSALERKLKKIWSEDSLKISRFVQPTKKGDSLAGATEMDFENGAPSQWVGGAGIMPLEERLSKILYFRNVNFSSSSLVIRFSMEPVATYSQSGGQGGQGSQDQFLDSVTVRASIDSLSFPSILEFAGFDSTIVRGLASNTLAQQEITDAYGYYDVSSVDNLVKDQLQKNNDAVSILGFDVSRKWFPIALLLVLAATYILLFQAVKSAKSIEAKIISGPESEDVLHFLVGKKSIRFAIWVLSPILIIALIWHSSLVHYTTPIYCVLGLAGLLCIIYGTRSYIKSLLL